MNLSIGTTKLLNVAIPLTCQLLLESLGYLKMFLFDSSSPPAFSDFLDFLVIQLSTNCCSYRCTAMISDLQAVTPINNLLGCHAVIPCCCNDLFQT